MQNTGEIYSVAQNCAWKRVFYSNNNTKIEACNANMSEIDYPWDIVVLVSDDMIPQIRGYDDILRSHMQARYPDTNGILWFNDGYQENKLNTLTIMGRKMYESFGYLYHPSYKSLFCDTEFTDLCKGNLQDKCTYVPYTIIRHEHPGTGFTQHMDSLYQKNQRYWNEDMYTYITRKTYAYDWSVLIPTIPGREASLQRLLTSVREKVNRICPSLRLDIRIGFDNKEKSIGVKRELLLQSAQGKYVSFIDDDDEITDAYVEDVWQMIQNKQQVMRLRGQIGGYTFTHSLAISLSEPMAKEGVFVRPPNHLNPMMTDIAKLVHFQDATRGEDLDWTLRLAKSGFLTQEYTSDPSRIHYIYNVRFAVHEQTLVNQSQTSYEQMLQAVWRPNGAVMEPSKTGERSIPILRLGPKGFVSN
jgi:dihydrofolate reductase